MSGISLSGVDAWTVQDRIAPGNYLANPADVERGASSGNHPQIKMTWRIKNGDYTGAEQKSQVTFTSAALGGVLQLLAALDIEPPQDGSAELESLDTFCDWTAKQLQTSKATAEIMIRLEDDYQGRTDEATGAVKQWPTVIGYRKPGPGSDAGDDASFHHGTRNGSDEKPPPF